MAPLARHDDATLVRTLDGTVGWLRGGLGAACDPPPLVRRRPDVAALSHAARAYLGVSYRLGGTTRRGIDCSALVQRAVRASAGAVLPRHSTDQVRDGHAAATPVGEPGDIVCIWAGPRRSPHVGLVLRGRRPGDRTVVHASATMRRVVEEPLERFLAHADRVAHVPYAQAVEQSACLPHR
ncbi:MAG: NlpC/P60 family protein [Vicinamibacterales bacterium]